MKFGHRRRQLNALQRELSSLNHWQRVLESNNKPTRRERDSEWMLDHMKSMVDKARTMLGVHRMTAEALANRLKLWIDVSPVNGVWVTRNKDPFGVPTDIIDVSTLK